MIGHVLLAKRIDQAQRVSDDAVRFLVPANLQIGVVEEIHRVKRVIGSAFLLLSAFFEASRDARFDWMLSCHRPRREKMCDGMWTACGDDGAIAA